MATDKQFRSDMVLLFEQRRKEKISLVAFYQHMLYKSVLALGGTDARISELGKEIAAAQKEQQ